MRKVESFQNHFQAQQNSVTKTPEISKAKIISSTLPMKILQPCPKLTKKTH